MAEVVIIEFCFSHAAHHHAQVLGFDDDPDALGLQHSCIAWAI